MMITYENVGPDEVDSIEAMARRIWPLVYAEMISAEQIDYMLDWMYSVETLRKEIHETGIVFLRIRFGEELAGFASFGPTRSGRTCSIHKIYIDPRFHRRGIGSDVLCEIERRVLQAGVPKLQLRVNRTNAPAIALYQKCGFEIAHEDCADIGGGFVMDDYVFEKVLNA